MIKKQKKSREERIIERRKELAKKGQVAAIWYQHIVDRMVGGRSGIILQLESQTGTCRDSGSTQQVKLTEAHCVIGNRGGHGTQRSKGGMVIVDHITQ